MQPCIRKQWPGSERPRWWFLLPCLIPLVPGGGLYYTMSYAVLKEMQQFRIYLSNTAEAAIGYCGRSDTGFGSGTPSDAGPVNRSAAPEKGRMRGEEDESKI